MVKRIAVRIAVGLIGVCIFASDVPASVRAPNVVPVVVRTPHFGFNRLLVSVTVCVPRTADCTTIDDVTVDTGSTGLRLEGAALPRSFHLPPVLDGLRRHIGECVRYAHDDAWGPLFKADVRIGGMVAADLPLQIVDANPRTAPEGCLSSGAPSTSNGTLGISQWVVDCQGRCVQDAVHPGYFACEATGCVPMPAVDRAFRLTNPVAAFSSHDNGFILDLPSVPDGGALEAQGTLTFGVDASSLHHAHILRLDTSGHFTTAYEGRAYPRSYIDSGTETYVLPDDSLTRCVHQTWAFCETPARSLHATMIGRDGASFETSFRVGLYPTVDPHHPGVSDGAAMDAPRDGDVFVWGAPFFLGRWIGVVMDGRSVVGRPDLIGPFYVIPSITDRR